MSLEWRTARAADAAALAFLADSVSETEAAAYLSAAEGYVCTEGDELIAFAGVQAVGGDRMQGRLIAGVALSADDPIEHLLDWQEAKARTAGCARLELLIPSDSSAVGTVVQRRHWDVELPLWEMERRTGSPFPTPDLPPDLRVVPYTSDLEAAFFRCYQEVYADQRLVVPHSRQKWSEILADPAFRPDLCALAVDKDEDVVAFVLCFVHPPEWDIGPVGTRTTWRRRGLSSALLATTLTAADADPDLQLATLTVDGASPTGAMRIYRAFGFTTTRTWHLYRRTTPLRA
jgi:GNAT superfamily N-acetyltransferase